LYNFYTFNVFGKFGSSIPPPVILPGLLYNAEEEEEEKKALVLGIINNLMQQV